MSGYPRNSEGNDVPMVCEFVDLPIDSITEFKELSHMFIAQHVGAIRIKKGESLALPCETAARYSVKTSIGFRRQ